LVEVGWQIKQFLLRSGRAEKGTSRLTDRQTHIIIAEVLFL